MTRGDEHKLITDHTERSLYVVDSMPIPLSPAWGCLRAALVRLQFELRMVADEARRSALLLVAFLALTGVGHASEPITPPVLSQEQPRCVCEWPANGAAFGETVEARLARLETALRLTKAERTVSRRGRK